MEKMKKLFVLLLKTSLLLTSIKADVSIISPDIKAQLPEDLELIEKMRPLFFETTPPGILSRINVFQHVDKKTVVKNSAIKKFGAKEVILKTKDNFSISSLYFKRKNAPVNIIYVTGFFDVFTPTKEWAAPFAVVFPNFNVMSFDWRGYGESSGTKNDFGTNAYKDILAAIDYLRKDNDKPIVLVGFCMGGAMCLHATIKAKGKQKPDAIVLNSQFTEFSNMVARAANGPGIGLFLKLALKNDFLLNRMANRLQGNPFELKPIELIDLISIPCYFEHSLRDSLAPIAGGIEVYKKAKCPKMFMVSSIGEHVRIHSKVPSQYQNGFYNFLETFKII